MIQKVKIISNIICYGPPPGFVMKLNSTSLFLQTVGYGSMVITMSEVLDITKKVDLFR